MRNNKKILIIAIFTISIIMSLTMVSAFKGEITLVASGDGTTSIGFPFSDVEKGDLIKVNLEGNGSTFTYIYGDTSDVVNYDEENPSSALTIRKNIGARSGNIEIEKDYSDWSLAVFADDQDVILTYDVEKVSNGISGYNNLILISIIGIALIINKRITK